MKKKEQLSSVSNLKVDLSQWRTYGTAEIDQTKGELYLKTLGDYIYTDYIRTSRGDWRIYFDLDSEVFSQSIWPNSGGAMYGNMTYYNERKERYYS